MYIKNKTTGLLFNLGEIIMSTLQARKSEAKRLHIVNNSFELVLRKGFAGVGLKEILDHCEVPKGSFYHYFQSKEAFGSELVQHYISGYQTRLNEIWDNDDLAKTKILRYFKLWIEAPEFEKGWSDSCLIVKLAAEVADLSEDMRLIMDQGVRSLVDRLTNLILLGQQDQSIQINGDAAVTAQVIYQMWLGAALLSKLQKDQTPLYQALQATELMLGNSK